MLKDLDFYNSDFREKYETSWNKTSKEEKIAEQIASQNENISLVKTRNNRVYKEKVQGFKESEFNKPSSIEDYLKEKSRKWKSLLTNLITFIDVEQYTFNNHFNLAKPISCMNKRLLLSFKTERNVSRVINLAREVGLLFCVSDEDYSYVNHEAKRYCYNKKAEKEIKDICNRLNINPLKINNNNNNNNIYIPMVDIFANDDEEDSSTGIQVKFSSTLRIPTENTTEKDIIRELYKRYPLTLEYGQQLADEINNKIERDTIIFQPTIKKSKSGKTWSHIGIRAYQSNICGEKKDRKKLLKSLWKSFSSYDVNGSIYRVTAFLNGKVLKGDGFCNKKENDIFKQFFDEYIKITNSNEKFDRDQMKVLCNRLYFSSPKNYLKGAKDCVKNYNKQNINKIEVDWEKDLEDLNALNEAMHNLIGDFYKSEIFFYESLLYIIFQHECVTNGHDVRSCYDCFYSKEDIKSLEKYFFKAKKIFKDIVEKEDYIRNESVI